MKQENIPTHSSFLNELNEAQRAAATAIKGTQLVIAGAGSGKTRVITARIAHLISEHHVPATGIVALTFTNKAGNEMKERIAQFLPDTPLPFVGTFHSYCVRLLHKYSHLLPFKDFTIFDGDDQRALIKKIMTQFGVEKHLTPAKMQGLISFTKNHLPDQQPTDLPVAPFFKEVAHAYEQEKNRSHAYDFDDLLNVTLQLFTEHEAVRTEWQHTVQHLLVDEYQDTNQIQHALLKTFALHRDGSLALESVCAVGDQDQSIYSWRGAQADNMLLFAKEFAPVSKYFIEQNYRSVQPILEAANKVIAHNPSRTPKELWSAKEATHRIVSAHCQSGSQESHIVTQAITTARKRIKLSEVAVLYRTHHQSRLIEEGLMRAGIPYRIIGGIRFYERKEIKDLLAYARLIANPFDRASLFRIINTPTRGIGDKCIELLFSYWEKEPLLNCQEILHRFAHDETISLNKSQREGFQSLTQLFEQLSTQEAPYKIMGHIIATTNYKEYIRKQYDEPELSARLENIDELEQAIRMFEQEAESPTLAAFLEHVVLMQEHTSEDEQPIEQVSLMTLHAAKGLEFDTVILSGLEEELFPSSRALQSSKDLEEERRLMYVGITRAKEYLLITHSQLRATYGAITQQMPSRFLQEIPDFLVTRCDMREMSPLMQTQFLSSWFHVPAPIGIQTYGGLQSSTSYTGARKGITSFTPQKRAPLPPAASTKVAPWKPRMPVVHASFGVGIIQKVDHKEGSEYYLTISFKNGTKKLSSKFVTRA